MGFDFGTGPGNYHHRGNKRTIDEESVRAELARLKAEPRSPERTQAIKKVRRQLARIGLRSPWRD